MTKRAILILAAAAASALPIGGLRGAPEGEVRVATDGRAVLPVVIGEQADPATKQAARDLAGTLERIVGAEFAIESGAGDAGIVVGVPGDFPDLPWNSQFPDDPFQRETYRIRSSPEGLWILGATPLAVRHGVWDVLYRLGYRQFFPGETWEVVPARKNIALSVDVEERPDFHARRIWYNWGFWGYNREPYREWSARNRMARGFMLHSGHAYGAIHRSRQKEFAAHPEYLALVDGKRQTRTGAKFCISNPGLRELVVGYAKERFRSNPDRDSISMDPSDGGGWCECDKCRDLGSVSDRALTLANEVAEGVNQLGLDEKYVGMYAYNFHCPPPSIEAHPNVIVSCTTGFLTGGYTFEEVVRGWQRKGATIGVYDYFSVVAWDWNLPRRARASRPEDLAQAIRKRHRMGARFYDAESGDAWGPYGLGYYVASRVLWDVDAAERTHDLVDDFLEKAFGPAREPMRAFYQLICEDEQKRSSSDLLARMYRHLRDARTQASEDAAVRERVDDLIKYTRYYELYERFANAVGDAKKQAEKDLLSYIYRIRKTSMVHAYGLWARLASQREAHRKDSPLKDGEPVTAEDVRRYLREGIDKNQPVDVDFEPVSFSRELLPAEGRFPIPDVAEGTYPSVPQSRQVFHIWIANADEGTVSIPLKVKTKKVWKKRMPKIVLRAVQGDQPIEVDADESWGPDNQWHAITLETPYRGHHTVEVLDGGDYSHVQWPDGMPVALESSMENRVAANYFRGAWTLYFYVPRGTEIVGGWARRIASWAPAVQGVLKDADGTVRKDFSKDGEGWFRVEVPDGQDGRFWKFENTQGLRRLATVPPWLAVHPRRLLLPRDVVEKDAPKP